MATDISQTDGSRRGERNGASVPARISLRLDTRINGVEIDLELSLPHWIVGDGIEPEVDSSGVSEGLSDKPDVY